MSRDVRQELPLSRTLLNLYLDKTIKIDISILDSNFIINVAKMSCSLFLTTKLCLQVGRPVSGSCIYV